MFDNPNNSHAKEAGHYPDDQRRKQVPIGAGEISFFTVLEEVWHEFEPTVA